MADVVKDTKPPVETKPKAKVEKKAPERAVFVSKRLFSRGGKQHDMGSYIRLTHEQVEAEIKLGMHKAGQKRREVAKPNSPVLNHCTLVSAGKSTKEALKKFGV